MKIDPHLYLLPLVGALTSTYMTYLHYGWQLRWRTAVRGLFIGAIIGTLLAVVTYWYFRL